MVSLACSLSGCVPDGAEVIVVLWDGFLALLIRPRQLLDIKVSVHLNDFLPSCIIRRFCASLITYHQVCVWALSLSDVDSRVQHLNLSIMLGRTYLNFVVSKLLHNFGIDFGLWWGCLFRLVSKHLMLVGFKLNWRGLALHQRDGHTINRRVIRLVASGQSYTTTNAVAFVDRSRPRAIGTVHLRLTAELVLRNSRSDWVVRWNHF